MTEHKSNFTLNNEVIPDDKFIDKLESYNPRLSEEIVKQICEEKGMNSSDPRTMRLIAILGQSFIEEIVKSTAESIISKKNNNKFLEWKELNEALKENGIESNKSLFFCDNLNVNIEKQNK